MVANYEEESSYIDRAYERVSALQVGARDPNVRVRKFSYVQVRFRNHPGTKATQRHHAILHKLTSRSAAPIFGPIASGGTKREAHWVGEADRGSLLCSMPSSLRRRGLQKWKMARKTREFRISSCRQSMTKRAEVGTHPPSSRQGDLSTLSAAKPLSSAQSSWTSCAISCAGTSATNCTRMLAHISSFAFPLRAMLFPSLPLTRSLGLGRTVRTKGRVIVKGAKMNMRRLKTEDSNGEPATRPKLGAVVSVDTLFAVRF